MKTLKMTCLVALLLSGAAVSHASVWNKLTRLTVHEPIAVPGATLKPGEYVVKLVDSTSNRHIVRFLNGDQTKVVATVLAVPNQRMQPTGQTELSFYETPAGEPVALRAWFYPGNTIGQEFVYPEKQAKRIARQAKRHVPATEDSVEAALRDNSIAPDSEPALILRQTRIYAWTPDDKKGEYAVGFTANENLDRASAGTKTNRKYAQFAQPSKTDSTRARSDNSRARRSIEREVRHELVMLPYYGVFDNLAFSVAGDTVTLLGQVTRPTLKSSAERVVKDIEGVERVNNNIEVLPLSPNDDRLRLAVYRAVYGQTALNRYALQAVPPIHLIVNNGNVTLEGVVASEADKNIANIQARGVAGVFSVTNNLRVEKSE